MKIVVSILHYKSPQDTLDCLNSLLKINQEGIALQTIVLDNGSTNKFEKDESNFKKIDLTILRQESNLGFTGGHNFVFDFVKNSDFDAFLILNNDCLLDPDSIGILAKSLKENKIGGVVPKIYFTKGHEYQKEYHGNERGRVIWYAGGKIDWKNVQSKHLGIDEVDNSQFDTSMEIDFATGACFLMKKNIIDKIGLFDNRYFLYFEDADLSQRIIRTGHKLLYQPQAVIWHNNAGSSGAGSSLHDYYLTRNRMLFGMKFAPIRTKIALVKESFRLLAYGRQWQKIGVKDYYLRKFNRGSYIPKG